LTVTHTATNSLGAEVLPLIETGGEFPPGLSEFSYTVSSPCVLVGTCLWQVNVNESNLVEVDVQLSPIIVGGPGTLQRCVELEFFSDCVTAPTLHEETMAFGSLFNLTGFASGVFKIPAGEYVCVTARDPLHTLRSVATPEIVGTRYEFGFTGDPAFGGTWLIGGNLNGDDVIDLTDYTLFIEELNSAVDPNTPCGTEPVHADFNGDGIVDGLDFSFVQENLWVVSKDACCADGVASAMVGGTTVILVEDLVREGLGHLAKADLTHDGVIDVDDVSAFLRGDRPHLKDSRSRVRPGH
jgi:hypothetical protein